MKVSSSLPPHPKIPLRYRLEYVAILAIEFFFRITPYQLCLWNACALSRFAFHILRWRRSEALRRIQSVFPSISPHNARRIAYLSLRNILLNAAEIMHLRGISDAWLQKHAPTAFQTITQLQSLTQTSGVVLALPHFGNWDLAGIAVAHGQIPIFSIAGIQHNPLTNQWLNNKRATGITILSRSSLAVRNVLKRLHAHEVFAILPDVRMKQPDLSIPFLGSTANLGRGMALFARKTNSPILLARVFRTSLSTHNITLDSPIYPDLSLPEEEDIFRMTNFVISSIDAQIRANPDQWFWYNKRWVLDPLPPPQP